MYLVDDVDSLIQSLHLNDVKNRSEDLLLVALHLGGNLADDGGSHKVSGLVALHLKVPSVQRDVCSLVSSTLDQPGGGV